MVWQSGRRKQRLDYHKKNFHNPYFNRSAEKSKRAFSFKMPHVPIKVVVRFLITAGLVYGLFWLVAKSNFFAIKNIEVVVPLKFNIDEVRGVALQESGGKKFGFSENNLLFFDSDKVRQELSRRYPVNNLAVKKIYPNKLFISFEEKIYEAIWFEAGKYYLINKDDETAIAIDQTVFKDKKFPLIKYIGPGERFANGFVASTSPKVRFIVDIYANISKNFVYKVDYVSVGDIGVGPIEVKIVNGPRVIFSERENLDKQLKKLYTIVNDRLRADFIKKSYVDVRFGDAVYIK